MAMVLAESPGGTCMEHEFQLPVEETWSGWAQSECIAMSELTKSAVSIEVSIQHSKDVLPMRDVEHAVHLCTSVAVQQ